MRRDLLIYSFLGGLLLVGVFVWMGVVASSGKPKPVAQWKAQPAPTLTAEQDRMIQDALARAPMERAREAAKKPKLSAGYVQITHKMVEDRWAGGKEAKYVYEISAANTGDGAFDGTLTFTIMNSSGNISNSQPYKLRMEPDTSWVLTMKTHYAPSTTENDSFGLRMSKWRVDSEAGKVDGGDLPRRFEETVTP